MADSSKADAEKRLSITRETELLQRFVRITVDDYENMENAEEKLYQIQLQQQEQAKKEAEETRPPKPKRHSADKIPGKSRRSSRQSDSKKKTKKRKLRKITEARQEEIYTDKDRAAAVNLGSKDIKHSLRLKRKEDRSRVLQIPEEAEPSTFLALGNYEMCRGDLDIALDFISKALELNPVEKTALVARSKCFILLGQPENALKDAETALQVDKNFMKAIYQKAEALYYLGDFEHSLVFYHRGLHIRPDHEGFKLGVHKAQKAIENALGTPFQKLIPSRATSSNNISTRSKTGNDEINESTCPKENEEQVGSSSKTTNVTTPMGKTKITKKSRLLRELGPDKEYLDNLMNNPNIKCKFKENDSTVEKCIKETVEYLNTRQEFWRQQLPPSLK